MAKLIGEAKKSIKIIAVVPSHGSYSAPEFWDRVRLAIEHRKAELNDRSLVGDLLYGNHDCLIRNYAAQFRGLDKRKQWKAWKDRKENHNRLKRFFEDQACSQHRRTDVDTVLLEDFFEIRAAHDLEVVEKVYRKFRMHPTPEIVPVFCWIVDGRKAIFSIKTEDLQGQGKYTGVGFFTRDPDLIKVLNQLFECYRSLKPTLPNDNSEPKDGVQEVAGD